MELFNRPPDGIVGYTAGIIDGEGTIWSVGSASARRSRYRVQISQADSNDGRALCEWLRDQWDCGRVYAQRGLCDIHIWNIVRVNEIAHVLDLCLPYLRVKRSRAQAALDFLRDRSNGTRRGIWTPGELSYLRDHRADPTAAVAAALERSADAVRFKRNELGLAPPARRR